MSNIGNYYTPIGDPTKIVNKRKQLEKEFDLASIVPEIKNYKNILSQTDERNVSPSTSTILNNNDDQEQQDETKKRLRAQSSIIRFSSASKHQMKNKKSKLFIKLSTTVNRPDILYNYLSYKDILQYLDYIKSRFPTFTRIHTIGNSFERRPIKCVEINFQDKSINSPALEMKQLDNDDNNMKKKQRNIIFIEGGTHAREWISITVALNCIYQLTERNVRHRDLLRKLIFYIVPVVNPDGYEYTRDVNPNWRKNRRPQTSGDNVGTDCNRNFDFHWNESYLKSKRNTFQGEKPFSEPETVALAAILNSLAPNLLFYLSLHSYAQSIMYPWGYTNKQPKNAKLMESVAIAGRNAIKTLTGRYYRVGSIAHITKRNISGSVIDYAHGVVNIPLTLVMELPSKEYGFQPPSDKIHPLGMESWHGIKEMCKKAHSLKLQIEQMQRKEECEERGVDNLESKPETDSTAHKKPPLKSNKSNKSKKLNPTKQRMAKGVINSMLDAK